jgi:putative transposase
LRQEDYWLGNYHIRAELSIVAPTMAIRRQKPHPGLIHHSDRCSQYAAAEYRKLVKAANPEKEITPIES